VAVAQVHPFPWQLAGLIPVHRRGPLWRRLRQGLLAIIITITMASSGCLVVASCSMFYLVMLTLSCQGFLMPPRPTPTFHGAIVVVFMRTGAKLVWRAVAPSDRAARPPRRFPFFVFFLNFFFQQFFLYISYVYNSSLWKKLCTQIEVLQKNYAHKLLLAKKYTHKLFFK
jgi:hypothetical protein